MAKQFPELNAKTTNQFNEIDAISDQELMSTSGGSLFLPFALCAPVAIIKLQH